MRACCEDGKSWVKYDKARKCNMYRVVEKESESEYEKEDSLRTRFDAKRRTTDVFMSDDEEDGVQQSKGAKTEADVESANGSEVAKSGARFGVSAKIKRRRDEGFLHNNCNTCM